MTIVTIAIDKTEFEDISGTTSVVFDATGFPLDDYLGGLCVDIENGRVQIRWGEGDGDHFVKWRPPFEPIAFEFDGRAYKFCLEGFEQLPSYTGEVL